jgi:hypothetical protein
MAYYVVIGTDAKIQNVVDEIGKSHLQHDVITSGCLLQDGGKTSYRWDAYNAKGDKTGATEDEAVELKDALTNQLAQFKTLLPNGVCPLVFIISPCFTESEIERTKWVYDELCATEGYSWSGITVELILIGYDLNNYQDVTKRPDFEVLQELYHIGANQCFTTHIVYVNNMDYKGAATNINSQLLGRLLFQFSNLISDSQNPITTVKTSAYCFGIAEYQYKFDDIEQFFRLSAEERNINHSLNSQPAPAVQEMLDKGHYSCIDLNKPWLNGFNKIKEIWQPYFNDYGEEKLPKELSHCLDKQEKEIKDYLQQFLDEYICQQNKEKTDLENTKTEEENNLKNKKTEFDSLDKTLSDYNDKEKELQAEIHAIEEKIESLSEKIELIKNDIEDNTFPHIKEISETFKTKVTAAEERDYKKQTDRYSQMRDYLVTDSAVQVMSDAINKSSDEKKWDEKPQYVLKDIGKLSPSEDTPRVIPTPPAPQEEKVQKSGCLMCFLNIFKKKKIESNTDPISNIAQAPALTKIDIIGQMRESVKLLKEVANARLWWDSLNKMIKEKSDRQKECKKQMDEFKVQDHAKSRTLIDMGMVRDFRDKNPFYEECIDKLINQYFSSDVSNPRPSLNDCIDNMIKKLRDKYGNLDWDGNNPFVKEDLSDTDLSQMINALETQSKLFAEYEHSGRAALGQKIYYTFYSDNDNIDYDPTNFKTRYEVENKMIVPHLSSQINNTICLCQVLGIIDLCEEIKDFKPTTKMNVSSSTIDYFPPVRDITNTQKSKKERAKDIYNWLIHNIDYDTSLAIHDADTCWKKRHGVCQAYCELFYQLAAKVGLVVEIISGIVKMPDNTIPEDKHSWIFVYTDHYDGIFIDPTWGAGYVENGKFVRIEEDKWFDVTPEELINTHFPDDEKWQHLDINITKDQFKDQEV